MTKERRIAVALRVDEPFPHHQEVLSGVLEFARNRPEWQCIVDEHPTYSHPRRGEKLRPYDGVIARASPELQRRLDKLGIPLVNIWYQHAELTVPGVYPEVATIGRLMANHLIDHGFRKLAFIGATGYRLDKEIAQAFAITARERGCPCVIDDCGPHPDFGHRSEWLALRRHVSSLLDTLAQPAGIFVTFSTVARVVMTMCHERDRQVAKNYGVACLDNVKSVVEVPPQITSIDSNYLRVGHAAAELLDQLMSGARPPNVVRLIPPKGLVPRDSTNYFSATDELVAAALQHIAGRLRMDLNVESIADALAVSPRTLQRRFEAAMDCSVSDEIRRLRVALAKRLLVEKDLSVNEIASEAGFSSAVTLNHVFHREVGMSPSGYRKEARGT